MPRSETETLTPTPTWQLPERRRTWRAPADMTLGTEGPGTISGLLLSWARSLAPGVELGWEMGWDGERLVTQLFANAPEPTLGAALPLLDELETMLRFVDLGVVPHTPDGAPPVVASVMPKAPGLHLTHLDGPSLSIDNDLVTRCLRHLAGTPEEAPKKRGARRTAAGKPFLAAFRARISHRRSASVQAELERVRRVPLQEPESSPFGGVPLSPNQELRNGAEAPVTVVIEVLAPRPLDRLSTFLVAKTWYPLLRKEVLDSSQPPAVAMGAPGEGYMADALHGMFLFAPAVEQLRRQAPNRASEDEELEEEERPRTRRRPRSFRV